MEVRVNEPSTRPPDRARWTGTASRAALVQRGVKTWTGELVDLGGRNTLLYYRDLKQGTLDLGKRERCERDRRR